MNDSGRETRPPEPPPVPPEIPKQADWRTGPSDESDTSHETRASSRHEAEEALKAEHGHATTGGQPRDDASSLADGKDTLRPSPEVQEDGVMTDDSTQDEGYGNAQGEQVRNHQNTAHTAAGEHAAATADDPTADDPTVTAHDDPATTSGRQDSDADQNGSDDQKAAAGESVEVDSVEGQKNYEVVDPADPGRTITDIDDVKDGVLWEEKSATFAGDIDKWVDKQVTGKLEKYVEAREHLSGYENAPIGLRMTEPGVDPPLCDAIKDAIDQFRQAHPGVDVRLEFTE